MLATAAVIGTEVGVRTSEKVLGEVIPSVDLDLLFRPDEFVIKNGVKTVAAPVTTVSKRGFATVDKMVRQGSGGVKRTVRAARKLAKRLKRLFKNDSASPIGEAEIAAFKADFDHVAKVIRTFGGSPPGGSVSTRGQLSALLDQMDAELQRLMSEVVPELSRVIARKNMDPTGLGDGDVSTLEALAEGIDAARSADILTDMIEHEDPYLPTQRVDERTIYEVATNRRLLKTGIQLLTEATLPLTMLEGAPMPVSVPFTLKGGAPMGPGISPFAEFVRRTPGAVINSITYAANGDTHVETTTGPLDYTNQELAGAQFALFTPFGDPRTTDNIYQRRDVSMCYSSLYWFNGDPTPGDWTEAMIWVGKLEGGVYKRVVDAPLYKTTTTTTGNASSWAGTVSFQHSPKDVLGVFFICNATAETTINHAASNQVRLLDTSQVLMLGAPGTPSYYSASREAFVATVPGRTFADYVADLGFSPLTYSFGTLDQFWHKHISPNVQALSVLTQLYLATYGEKMPTGLSLFEQQRWLLSKGPDVLNAFLAYLVDNEGSIIASDSITLYRRRGFN